MVGAGAAHPAPERVGRYEVLLPIASGGMAAVYLARSQGAAGFEQQVALKVTHPHLLGGSEFVADLVEEAKLAARIRHRNVISVLDVGDDAVGVFLVMEYVEGDTLANIRRRMDREGAELPLAVTGRILVDALAGLHAAHELTDEHGGPLGLVHRDVTPQNLLLGVDGVVRLADFGIAKATTRLGQTQSGLVKGKVAYMSPEQAKGAPLDRRCDIWATGIMAWELFSGRRLYEGLEEIAIILRLVKDPPPRLRTVMPDVHPAVDEVVAKALTLDPNDRIPTAQAFSRELVAACRAAGGLAETDEVAELVQRVVGPKLAERRRTVASILELRSKQQALIAAASPAVLSGRAEARPSHPSLPDIPLSQPRPQTADSAFVPVVPPGQDTGTTSVSASMGLGSVLPARKSAIPPWALAIPVGMLAGGILLGGLALALRRTKSGPEATVSSASSAVVTADPPPKTADPPPKTADPPPKTADPPLITVRVSANAAISEVKVDGKVRAFDGQGREISVALLPDEATGAFEVVATDGRKTSAVLGAGATTLTVDFPSPPTAAVAAPAVQPVTTPRPRPKTPSPGLAADPYKK